MSLVHRAALAVLVAVVACGEGTAPAGELDLSRDWTTAAPAAVGLSSAQLEAAAAEAAAIPRMRSLLVVRQGRLAFERYFVDAGPNTRFDVRSVTKSVVATLAGIALAEGALPDRDQGIGAWLDGFTLDDQDRTVTISHLLSMTSGYLWDEWSGPSYQQWRGGGEHLQYVLDLPRAAAAGSHFTYNSGAVHMLGFIVGRAGGGSLPAYAESRLFDRVGITSQVWEEMEAGTVNGGAGLDLTGQDLLRFGQLYLQRGRSGGRQVVPASWIDDATTPQSSFLGTAGPMNGVRYGFLWWIWPEGGAYFAWGYGGQFVFVVPADDLVIVATTEWRTITETTPYAVESAVLGVIVNGVLPAVMN